MMNDLCRIPFLPSQGSTDIPFGPSPIQIREGDLLYWSESKQRIRSVSSDKSSDPT